MTAAGWPLPADGRCRCGGRAWERRRQPPLRNAGTVPGTRSHRPTRGPPAGSAVPGPASGGRGQPGPAPAPGTGSLDLRPPTGVPGARAFQAASKRSQMASISAENDCGSDASRPSELASLMAHSPKRLSKRSPCVAIPPYFSRSSTRCKIGPSQTGTTSAAGRVC